MPHGRQLVLDAIEGTEGLRFVLVLLQSGLRLLTYWISGRSWAGSGRAVTEFLASQ